MGNAGKPSHFSNSRQRAREAEKARHDRELEILLAEYKVRSDEIIMMSQRYGRFMMSVITLLSAIAVVGRLVMRDGSVLSGELATKLPISAPAANSDHWAPILLLWGVPMLVFYLLASTMDSLYMIGLNGLRRSAIEKALNQLADKPLLVWEAGVMGAIFMKPGVHFRRYLWIQPNLLQGLFLFGLLIVSFCFLGNMAHEFMAPFQFYAYLGFLAVGLLFLIVYQWAVMLTRVHKQNQVRISELSKRQREV